MRRKQTKPELVDNPQLPALPSDSETILRMAEENPAALFLALKERARASCVPSLTVKLGSHKGAETVRILVDSDFRPTPQAIAEAIATAPAVAGDDKVTVGALPTITKWRAPKG